MKKENNIRILAENNKNLDGFNIFVVFSGQREYLMFHRHNGLLYNHLKNGVILRDLRRWRPSRPSDKKLFGMIRHLLRVVDEHITEREAWQEIA